MKAILIDGESRDLYQIDMIPSHLAIEEEIGTRFWVMRRLSVVGGEVLFHAEVGPKGYESFAYRGVAYFGSALICRIDSYGDLASTALTVEEVRKEISWLAGSIPVGKRRGGS